MENLHSRTSSSLCSPWKIWNFLKGYSGVFFLISLFVNFTLIYFILVNREMICLGQTIELETIAPEPQPTSEEQPTSESIDKPSTLPPPAKRLSDMWKPRIETSCLKDSNTIYYSKFASCFPKSSTNLIQTQDFIYPNFQFHLAEMIDDSQKELYVKLTKETIQREQSTYLKRFRFSISNDTNWLIYNNDNFGQNLVFVNSTITRKYPTGFCPTCCMAYYVSHKPFLTGGTNIPYDDSNALDSLFIANSPGGAGFQHFMDRVVNMYVQSDFLFDDPTKRNHSAAILESSPSAGDVHNNLQWVSNYFGVPKFLTLNSQFNSKDQFFHAKKLYFSCRTPLIHPYIMLATNEKIGVYKRKFIPVKDRNLIVYFQRKSNRRVYNEQELVKQLKELLVQRGKGESLVYLTELYSKYPNKEDFLNIMANVSAIFGPHGGALYNARFAQPQTLVVEFSPPGKFGYIFLEQSRSLGQRFFQHIPLGYDSLREESGMTIDIPGVMKIFTNELGKEYDASQHIKLIPESERVLDYPWTNN